MQWVDAAEAHQRETGKLIRLAQPAAVGAGDDEARQHEEEIDEQIGAADKGALREHRPRWEMEQRHHQRADAAPGIGHQEAPAGRRAGPDLRRSGREVQQGSFSYDDTNPVLPWHSLRAIPYPQAVTGMLRAASVVVAAR